MNAAHEAPGSFARRAVAGAEPNAGRWRGLLVMAVWLSLLLAADREANAEDKDKAPPLPKEIAKLARQYASVEGWIGFWEAEETASFDSGVAAGGQYSRSSTERRGSGTFRLERNSDAAWNPTQGRFKWVGGGKDQYSVFSDSSERHNQGGHELNSRAQGELSNPACWFTVWLDEGTAVAVAGSAAGSLPSEETGTLYFLEGEGMKKVMTSEPISRKRTAANIINPLRVLQRNGHFRYLQGPGVLSFHDSEENAGNRYRSRLTLAPVYDDLEVEVTIEGHAKWRPEGSIADPQQPGNGLVAHAVLKSKDGKTKQLPEVARFKFELLDTSREPGVCLNWPLKARDADFDLRLAAEGGGELSAGEQKLELASPPKDDKGRPYAEARIDSYDFGGKATLQVICELEDGREIMGLMKGEGGQEDLVRLPKMKSPGWIADSWRQENKAENLGDNDDNEKIDGQKDNGDGYTLYEEYRGWVEKGRHIEGSSLKKDFFILNLIEADGRGGIALFGRLSKLRVHSRLRDAKEMSQEDRLMNGNHREAPHRVDQHGVVLSNVGRSPGGGTVSIEGTDSKKAARPRSVNWVYVDSRGFDGPLSLKAGVEYNLSERDALLAYDRAVAHELLHAVGVDHHGEVTWRLVRCNFQGASAPLNPIRRARYTTIRGFHSSQIDLPAEWRSNPGATITLLWEDTGREVIEESIAAYEAELAVHRASNRTENFVRDYAATATRLAALGVVKNSSFWAEYDADILASMDHIRSIRVGQPNGTDSGNELCVMRYYFADAFKITGRENAYYLIRPGSSRAGREICTSPLGTGTNAEAHEPQSRFGDAYVRRGNCFGDICPNDAIPPRLAY